MATNYTKIPGWKESVACSYPAVPSSNDPIRYGYRTGIALKDEDADGKTVVDFGPGKAKVSVADSEGAGISAGDVIWFHDATQKLNNTPTGGYYFGIAMAAVTAGETSTINVFHDPAPGGAGTIGAGTVGTSQLADTGVTTGKLSTVANDRPILIPIGAVSATATVVAFVAPTAGSLKSAKMVNKTAISVSDTDYWTFTLINTGSTGDGTDQVVEKTTKETGGSALEAYVALSLGTLDVDNKVLAAGDVVTLTITKAGSAMALAEAALALVWVPAEA